MMHLLQYGVGLYSERAHSEVLVPWIVDIFPEADSGGRRRRAGGVIWRFGSP
jgi:hypothetical protein